MFNQLIHQILFHGLQRFPDRDRLPLDDDARLGEVQDAALEGDAVPGHDRCRRRKLIVGQK